MDQMNRIDLQQARLGYVYVSLAAVLFAVSGTSAKYLFNGGVTAFQLIQMRTSLAFAGLLIWLCLKNPALLKIAPKNIAYFAGLGVFGIGSAQFFYLLAISKINVAAAILLHYTGPVFVALYVVLIQRRRLRFNSVLAIFGTLLGCYLVVGAYNLQLFALNRAGIAAGILAAVSFAVYSVSSEYGMRKYTPWTVLLYGMLFAALMWNILHPPLEAFFHRYSAFQWGLILFIGVGGTIVPFGLYFEGVRRIKPTHASITATLEPISAGVIAAVFLGEMMGALQITGGLIVIVSIILLQFNTADR
jgi:drug/metabolite transporter (DMT)-like permease